VKLPQQTALTGFGGPVLACTVFFFFHFLKRNFAIFVVGQLSASRTNADCMQYMEAVVG
jgi:hypothetical protein